MSERRARYKVQELGVADLVDELLVRGETYESIASIVRQRSGIEIGKSSIARYNEPLQRKLQRVALAKESAQAIGRMIAQKTGEEPDTELTEMLSATTQVLLLEKLGDEDMNVKDLTSLAFASGDAIRSSAALEKLKATERKRQAKAWDRVLAQSKEILQASPFWPEIEAILVAARTSAVEGAK